MDEIDLAVWVLEPENPNRMAVLRRIAISRCMTSIPLKVDFPLSLSVLETWKLITFLFQCSECVLVDIPAHQKLPAAVLRL